MPARFRDTAPRVVKHPDTGINTWFIAGQWLTPEAEYGFTGSPNYPPIYPKHLDEIDPGAWRAAERIQRMDEYGVTAQVLYPNLIGFETALFIRLGQEESLAAVRAYNDFLVEFASEAPDRLLPIAMVPFWDLDAAVTEIRRARQIGHRGILFANKYEKMGLGLPPFWDDHWSPVYAAAQDLEMSVNFHVGVGTWAEGVAARIAETRRNWDPAAAARGTTISMMSNAEPIAAIVTSGLCDRFPKVKFVSVESGFGYVPFLLDLLDWQWKVYGAHLQSPMLPSEYFRRQCYGSLWFETTTLPLLSAYPDNFMFETDYPHQTSLTPGPCSPAPLPAEHIRRHYGDIPTEVMHKLLYHNAAHVYGLDQPTTTGG